jgi:glucokinase
MSKRVIGVDLGGTFIKSAILDTDGNILERGKSHTGKKKTPDDVVTRICEDIMVLLDKQSLDKNDIIGVGLGSPGPLSSEKGLVYSTPNLPNWNNVPLQNMVAEKCGFPTRLFNDANAAAYGEFWKGAGSNSNTFLLFTLGTGVGGGIILNGKICRGIDGSAGELGHIAIDPNGETCGCGSKGCIETLASATAVVRIAKKRIEHGEKTSLEPKELTAKKIFMAAVDGDLLSKEILATAGKNLGIVCGGLINILNPEIIAIGGGLSLAGELLFKEIREEAKRRSFELPYNRVKIVPASLGTDAGVIGAAGLLLSERTD